MSQFRVLEGNCQVQNNNVFTIGTIGINRVKTTDTTDSLNHHYENDELYEQLSDLVTGQFRPWFCKHFYRLGRERVLQLAAVAKADGKDPKKYFCKLLKEA